MGITLVVAAKNISRTTFHYKTQQLLLKVWHYLNHFCTSLYFHKREGTTIVIIIIKVINSHE